MSVRDQDEDQLDAVPMWDCEVKFMLSSLKASGEKLSANCDKTLEYLSAFTKTVADQDQSAHLRKRLNQKNTSLPRNNQISEFELAALVSLKATTSEEAMTLIPSLQSKFSFPEDADLTEFLHIIESSLN